MVAALLPISVALGVLIAGVPSRHHDRAIRVSLATTTTSTSLPSTSTTTAITLPGTTSTTAAPVTYAVKSGDTLSRIAAQVGVSVSALASSNKISNPNAISVGEVLVIPPPGA